MINERQIRMRIASAARSRVADYPPDSIRQLLDDARDLLVLLDQEREGVVGDQYVTFFPHGDFKPSEGYISYGPFTLEEATAHARTLSCDPDEGEIARLVTPNEPE